ncbi:MAG: sensor domain-containing diguanylate cyclase [Desulfobacteraceae bacterium]|nr:sensor domain-containing diguanylate cyclase [Desulfobacteraceae bacterium]
MPRQTRETDLGVQPCENSASCAPDGDIVCDFLKLQSENEELRDKLAQVLENASENEKIWRHFAAIERILFRTRELDRLTEELLREIRVRLQTGLLVLYLCHPELRERFFGGEPEQSRFVDEMTWLSSLDAESVRSLLGAGLKPRLFSTDTGEYPAVFSQTESMRSGALIPLSINDVVFGALLLGSHDPGRYHPADGTDLLEQLGVNIALSMDNCLTYEKVRDFSVKDQLTGLFNFFQIHTLLENEFRKAKRSAGPLSVLLVSLDFVHDWDEFENGMDVLKHAAGLLSDILPKEGCFIGRYGSDEFLAVLAGVPEEEAREVIPYISSTMRKAPFRDGNTAILISAAIGVGTLNEGMLCGQDMVDAAYAELCTTRLRPQKSD